MSILIKLIKLIPLNLAGLIGIAQGIVKTIKEILTTIVNNIFPFTPDDGTFEDIIYKLRAIVNTVDEVLEKIKGFLLGTAGL